MKLFEGVAIDGPAFGEWIGNGSDRFIYLMPPRPLRLVRYDSTATMSPMESVTYTVHQWHDGESIRGFFWSMEAPEHGWRWLTLLFHFMAQLPDVEAP